MGRVVLSAAISRPSRDRGPRLASFTLCVNEPLGGQAGLRLRLGS